MHFWGRSPSLFVSPSYFATRGGFPSGAAAAMPVGGGGQIIRSSNMFQRNFKASCAVQVASNISHIPIFSDSNDHILEVNPPFLGQISKPSGRIGAGSGACTTQLSSWNSPETSRCGESHDCFFLVVETGTYPVKPRKSWINVMEILEH